MRKLIPIFFLLIWAQSARAQNFTTVTASNIQDVSGAKLASGMLCFDATNATNPSNDTPSNEISFQAGGGGQVIRGPICTPVTNGAIGTFQVPNSANTIPPGVAYHVYVVRGFYHVLDYYGVQVTGSTWSFDNYNPNSPTPAPPTGASVNGPLTVNGNLSVTGSLSLTSLALTTPLAVQYGGTGTSTPGLVSGSNISISGSWPNQTIATVSSPTFSGLTSAGAIYVTSPSSGQCAMIRLYGASAGTDFGTDINNCNPNVSGVSGTVLWIGKGGPIQFAMDTSGNVGILGTLKLGTPLAVAYGGTGTSSPSLVAGAGISVSGTWPNQTITNSDDTYFSGGILTVAHGGTGTSSPGLVAGSNISISGTWPNQTIATSATPIFSTVTIGSNPNIWIGQDNGVGNILFRTNQGTKDTWLFSVPDLSTANPVVTIFGGAQLGANPRLQLNGTLQATNLIVMAPSMPTSIDGGARYVFSSYDTSGYTSIGASNVVSVSGVNATSFYVANTATVARIAVDNSGNLGVQGTIRLGTPLAVQYGGTGTSNPSLIAGQGISITGTWPNQTISATGGGGSATSIQTSASDTTWAGIASTTLVSTSQNTGGVWTINVFSELTAAGAGCTTGDGPTNMSVNISYTDANTNSAVTVTSLATLNLSSGNGTVGTKGTGTAIIYPKSGTAISYSTTVSLNSTCTTVPQYMIALQAIH